MNRVLPTSVLVLAAALSIYQPLANAAQNVYRWTDERGNQVNSDRPPPIGIQYEVITTQSSMVRAVDKETDGAPAKLESGADDASKAADPNKPKVEKNPEYCARAKENLATLDTHARIRLRDEKGEVRYLSEEEKQIERKKALDIVEANCE